MTEVGWIFNDGGKAIFNPATMELAKGERMSEANQQVLLVTSLGVSGRGTSSGEDFEMEKLHLRTEVSCMEPDRRL